MAQVLMRWRDPTLTGNEALFLSNCVSVCQSELSLNGGGLFSVSGLFRTDLLEAHRVSQN